MIYKTYRSTGVIPAAQAAGLDVQDTICLPHDARYLRRKMLHFDNGDMIMLDFKQTVQLAEGDVLAADSGEHFGVRAAIEPLYEVKARDALHLLELAWHLGNRHLAVQVFCDRITLLRDHVIADMLRGLGATVREIEAPFQPLHGAYHDHSHSHH